MELQMEGTADLGVGVQDVGKDANGQDLAGNGSGNTGGTSSGVTVKKEVISCDIGQDVIVGKDVNGQNVNGQDVNSQDVAGNGGKDAGDTSAGMPVKEHDASATVHDAGQDANHQFRGSGQTASKFSVVIVKKEHSSCDDAGHDVTGQPDGMTVDAAIDVDGCGMDKDTIGPDGNGKNTVGKRTRLAKKRELQSGDDAGQGNGNKKNATGSRSDASIDIDDDDCEAKSTTSSDNASEYNDSHQVAKKRQKTSKGNKASREVKKPAKTAREYVARLANRPGGVWGDGTAAPGQKRKHGDNAAADLSNLMTTADDQRVSAAPAMVSINANTHKRQFALLNESVPEGADTRRLMTQKKDLHEAAKIFGNRMIKAHNGNWLHVGMNTALRNCQITAAAWMVKRECSPDLPQGGILADVMGMGKTIMSLACIVGNPPDEEDVKNFCYTTLVVVPNQSTALQWKAEVEKHCKDPFAKRAEVYRPLEHHHNPLGGGNNDLRVLVMTYHQLAHAFGRVNPKSKAPPRARSKVFDTKWYRIILDEAHAIKSEYSQTTSVCWALESKYRWALSGTPLSNSSEEMYPFLKFLRCQGAEDRRSLKRNFPRNEHGEQNEAFESLVSMVLYRRTFNDTFMGTRIIELPTSSQVDIVAPLSGVECSIMVFLDNIYQRKIELAELEADAGPINSRLATGIISQEKLLRFRQMIKYLKRVLARDQKETVLETVIKHAKFESSGLAQVEKGLNFLKTFTHAPIGGAFDWGKILDLFEAVARDRDLPCMRPGCKEKNPKGRVKLECGHAYCKDCHLNLLKIGQYSGLQCRAKDCEGLLCPFQDIGGATEDSHPAKTKVPGQDANRVQIHHGGGLLPPSFLGINNGQQCTLAPGTKLIVTMSILMTWVQDHPEDKIIVFVQFITTAMMLGCMLEQANLQDNFLYYVGSMKQVQKVDALHDFNYKPERKILIATMKCGGQSLNLTVANRVIIVDPWWNTVAEKQAFGRVVRIGQTKDQVLVRVRVPAPIEKRMQELQIQKAADVDHTLQDDRER